MWQQQLFRRHYLFLDIFVQLEVLIKLIAGRDSISERRKINAATVHHYLLEEME